MILALSKKADGFKHSLNPLCLCLKWPCKSNDIYNSGIIYLLCYCRIWQTVDLLCIIWHSFVRLSSVVLLSPLLNAIDHRPRMLLSSLMLSNATKFPKRYNAPLKGMSYCVAFCWFTYYFMNIELQDNT